MTTLSIEIDDEIAERLRLIAEANHTDTKSLVTEFLRNIVDSDEARWAEYQSTGHYIRHADALDWLHHLASGERLPCPK
jgi:predicted transcriptional regulator